MLTPGLVVVIVVGVAVSTIIRMRAAAKVPTLFWLFLLAAMALPLWVGWSVLFPKQPVISKSISKEGQKHTLTLPPNHALMITGILSDTLDEENEASFKTDYSLDIVGNQGNIDWEQSISGTIERAAVDQSKIKLDVEGKAEVSEKGKKREVAGTYQNIQDRFELRHYGDIHIEATNYNGLAAKSITIDVIPAPPANALLWALAVFFSLVGVYYEAWKQCDKVAGDIGLLVFYAVFLADKITPMDGLKEVGFAAFAAFFFGHAIVAGTAFLACKYVESNNKES